MSVNKKQIELACDCAEAKKFCQWLKEQGHKASIGNTTGTYVDGVWTVESETAQDIINELWLQYCKS